MARLVARALRLGRGALIQVGAACGYQGHYRLSYLAPALLWSKPTIIVAPIEVQQRLKTVEIPRLQEWFQTHKAIRTGERWPSHDFQGLLLTSPEAWLAAQLARREEFPPGIPTIIDGVDDLEDWARTQLTASIQPSDWEELMLARPSQIETIREARVRLTRLVFQHPVNPYECYLIESKEQNILRRLYATLQAPEGSNSLSDLPPAWRDFEQRLRAETQRFAPSSSGDALTQAQIFWATVARRQGLFTLSSAPAEVASALSPIWSKQPVVLIGSTLDREAEAPIYRGNVGLSDLTKSTQLPEEASGRTLTCLKFSADRQNDLIQLYLPDQLPLPNTPEFQAACFQKVHSLLCLSATAPGLTVLLVGDVPLKAQIGATLAAEFGSRVQVEKTCLEENGILVSGWEFWRQHQAVLPAPLLLVIATLPLPSLENPLVSGRVNYYKQSRQDWFRLYLLPEALSELARAVAPMREHQGVVALLDSRVLHRSYGSQVLAALSPLARLSYLDNSVFAQPNG